MRVIALTLSMLIGLIWLLAELILWLYTGGWAFHSVKGALLSVGGSALMFAPPLCLVVGSILASRRSDPRYYIPIFAIGSVYLTAVVGSSVHDQFHLNSAEIPSSALFLGSLIAAALFCNVCAVWLGRDWSRL